MKKLSGVFICLLLFTVLSSARIIEVADAGITDKLKAVIAAKNAPAGGGTPYTKYIGDNTSGSPSMDYAGAEDTMLYESNNGYNYGITATIEVGKYSSGGYRMVLIKFSGLSNIPATATVTGATFYFYNTASTATQTVTMRRMLLNWAEGSQDGAEGDPNWTYLANPTAWTTGGALSDGNDRSAAVTCSFEITNAGSQYYSCTSAQLIADVQNFVDGGQSNYGWHLERTDGADDSVYMTYQSSEGTNGQRPYLKVDYTD